MMKLETAGTYILTGIVPVPTHRVYWYYYGTGTGTVICSLRTTVVPGTYAAEQRPQKSFYLPGTRGLGTYDVLKTN